jgi:indolepyruvate ferredoxin oxidoreductase
LHVGADALAVGNLMEIRKREGGTVVVVGDDPWNETTQINSDSRYLSRHLHMPVIEPSTFQEVHEQPRGQTHRAYRRRHGGRKAKPQ